MEGLLIFLSTPSARRATHPEPPAFLQTFYFYPRPPRGGRRGLPKTQRISKKFLSTPSARRATNLIAMVAAGAGISIHALREEGDASSK